MYEKAVVNLNKSYLFPTYNKFPLTLVSGHRTTLWDDEGKSYLDFMAGLAQQTGAYALDKLRKELKAYPAIRIVRGLGLLIGIEFTEPVAPIIQKLHQNGLLVLPGELTSSVLCQAYA
ncbi:aminotransferase class III-fold pyridoxal phosphate-dependent enzyme [Paenibacillus sp. DMB20]|uniref:aminotransferase class III-fold pyridoxal phosphate-dependent enzyme n=1 Tax=Paenibacillus sp. DMB20 TaxID=1642570 RepID=UPI000627FEC7|nr:aminotransferase class III-fold pyridoxal phosphate-dependent enzyme [Paenibacillus sp. DMB20]KKO51609.1 hypothetical protein XI25_24440 [Paenibacillus sp. DMB20]